jgi:hypothetical protein
MNIARVAEKKDQLGWRVPDTGANGQGGERACDVWEPDVGQRVHPKLRLARHKLRLTRHKRWRLPRKVRSASRRVAGVFSLEDGGLVNRVLGDVVKHVWSCHFQDAEDADGIKVKAYPRMKILQ